MRSVGLAGFVALLLIAGDAALAQVTGSSVEIPVTSSGLVTGVGIWRDPRDGAATASDGLYKILDVAGASTVLKVTNGNYGQGTDVNPRGAPYPAVPKDFMAPRIGTGTFRLEWWNLEIVNPPYGAILGQTQDFSGGNGGVVLAQGNSVRHGGVPDGASDVFFAEKVTTGPATAGIWVADSTNGFTVAQTQTFNMNIQGATAFDADGDGDDDGFAITVDNPSPSSDEVHILLDDGATPFQVAQTIVVPEAPRGIAAGDFDGDGDEELLIGHADPASGVTGLRGTGVLSAPFETSALIVSWPLQGTVPAPLVLTGQLDGDSAPEFVLGFERIIVAGDFNSTFPLRSPAVASYEEYWGSSPIPPVVHVAPGTSPLEQFVGGQGGNIVLWWRDAGSQNKFNVGQTVVGAPGNDPNADARVKMISGNGALMGDFIPYAAKFGANVGSGDLRGNHPATGTDAWPVLTGPGPSPVFGPHVKAWDGLSLAPISKVNFFSYGTLKYGVKPAAGDIEGDGFEEILTGPGPGDVFGPHVRAWNYDGATLTAINKVSFFAYGTLKYGVNVAGGDVDNETAYEEIVTGPGGKDPEGCAFVPQVRGFNYDGQVVTQIGQINMVLPFAGQQGGATVGTADTDNDGRQDIIVGSGVCSPSEAAVITFGNRILVPPFSTFPGLLGASVAGTETDGVAPAEFVVAPYGPAAAPARMRIYRGDGTPTGVDVTPFTSGYGARVGSGFLY